MKAALRGELMVGWGKEKRRPLPNACPKKTKGLAMTVKGSQAQKEKETKSALTGRPKMRKG